MRVLAVLSCLLLGSVPIRGEQPVRVAIDQNSRVGSAVVVVGKSTLGERRWVLHPDGRWTATAAATDEAATDEAATDEGVDAFVELLPAVWTFAVEPMGEGPPVWAPTTELDLSGIRSGEPMPRLGLDVWPAGEMVGTLAAARGASLPEVVEMTVQPHVGGASGGATRASLLSPAGSLRCALDRSGASRATFRCPVPAHIPLDLKLRGRGHVSHFFWDMRLEVGEERDLGHRILRPGASMIGSIETVDGALLDDDETLVELVPAGRDGSSLRAVRVRPTQDGFFHVTGMGPGAYTLRVESPGYLDFETPGVEIFDGFEAELSRPVVLERPASLTLQLEPAQAAEGARWTIELLPLATHRRGVAGPTSARADLTGLVELVGLEPGQHLLSVADASGVVTRREVEVRSGESFQVVDLDLVPVEGLLLLGDEPLPGVVTFGGRGGTTMEADEDGVFRGMLDEEGEWRVVVDAAEPPIARRLRGVEVERGESGVAEVEIALPDTRLIGRVVGPDGQPPGQSVFVDFRPLTRNDRKSTVRSDPDDGVFEILGVPPGPLALRARSTSASSDEQIVDVVEDLQLDDVVLVLRDLVSLAGLVRSSEGLPVPGARVAYRLAERLQAPGGSATTDDAGAFTLEVPDEPGALHLWIEAQGYGLDARRVVVDPAQSLDLTVSRAVGTLVVELEPGQIDVGGGYGLFLRRGGSYLTQAQLTGWAVRQPGGAITPERIVVPRLAPGAYAACQLEIGGGDWARFFLDPAFVPSTCRSLRIEVGGETPLVLESSRSPSGANEGAAAD